MVHPLFVSERFRHKKLRLPPFPSQLQDQTYFVTTNFTAGTKQTISFSINLFQRGGVVQGSLKRILLVENAIARESCVENCLT